MAFYKALNGVMDTLHTIGTKVAGPIGGHALRAVGKVGFKGGGKVLDAAAGVINGAIENSGKINKQSIGKAVNKTITNTLTDDSAYKQIGKLGKNGAPVMGANKFLLADDMERRVKSIGDHLGNAYSMATKEGPGQLLKKSDDSLIGLKATGLGVTVAAGAMAVSGTPGAVKEWNKGRQGTNQDMMPVTSAPRTPAYAQNGGATGDLVFALNNLRHGGMM